MRQRIILRHRARLFRQGGVSLDAASQTTSGTKRIIVIERRLHREIHYKTLGMTLYRMAEAGEVRRDGYDWFAVKAPEPTPPEEIDDLIGGGFSVEEDEEGPSLLPEQEIDWLEEQYREAQMRDG